MERLASVGIPPDRGGNEFHRDLRDELDHAGVLPKGFGDPSGQGDRRARLTNFPASGVWFGSNSDILDHPALDVPSKDFLEDLTFCGKFSGPWKHPRELQTTSSQLVRGLID